MDQPSLRIETASAKLVRAQYAELFQELDRGRFRYEIFEEPVAFGPEQDLLLVGLVFIWESVKSGITWDLIKDQMQKVLGFVESRKLKNVSICVETHRPKKRYEINVSYSNESVEISLPDGTHIGIRPPK